MFTKLLKYYLKKHLTVHPKHYYFLRWLVNLIEDKDTIEAVCSAVSYWSLIKPDNGRLLQYIKDIFVLDNIVYIYTDRPGLLIGKSGSIVAGIVAQINFSCVRPVIKGKVTNYTVNFIEMNDVSYTRILRYIRFQTDY